MPTSRATEGSLQTWHVITGEYPPQSGGVSDYVFLLAKALAEAHDEVHIWCPRYERPALELPGVTVHGTLGRFLPADLRQTARELDNFPAPRHLLIQWVPHAYGHRSLNVPFCLWLRNRARRGDAIDLMVHEPYLPFKRSSLRQTVAALVHRLMTMIVLRSAKHVWISTLAWRPYLEPYAPARPLGFDWLPVPSNVPVAGNGGEATRIRDRYAPNGLLVGHFGTYGSAIAASLREILTGMLREIPETPVLLMGGGSQRFLEDFIAKCPSAKGKIQATGRLGQMELSHHLSACDVLIQPYPDGVSSRRTTVMAALEHGRAVVTTSGPLTESIWESSRAVALAPAGDTEAFLRSLTRLMTSNEERIRLGDAAGELYRSRFDMLHVVDLLRAKQ